MASPGVSGVRVRLTADFLARHPTHVVLHALAIRLAKGCRDRLGHRLDAAECRECDEAFYRVIHEGLEELEAARQLHEVIA